MRLRSALLAFLLAIGGAALPAHDTTAQPGLNDTYWEADDDCFIVDLAFYSDGTVDIDYDNGEEDTGTWTLSDTGVKIMFDTFEDEFIGSYSGDAIRAAHIWYDQEGDTPEAETCVFHRADSDKHVPRDTTPPPRQPPEPRRGGKFAAHCGLPLHVARA